MPKRFTIVVSQAQSQNPKKRAIEEAIVGSLLGERGVDVAIVPHLYDLKADSPELVGLQSLASDLIVCAWLYPRAARWTLDRNGIRGKEGQTLIAAYGESDEDEPEDDDTTPEDDKQRVLESRPTPNRSVYCLDLRTHPSAEPYIEEVRRIVAEGTVSTVSLGDFGPLGNDGDQSTADPLAARTPPPAPTEQPARRWYPVIDYSRCTNCMECIDFCLFGVYGLDTAETILVEQPDNCRKGCPACSRVCPENAIIFPQHKTPTIAGSPDVGGPMKIDLSKLFGAPDPGAPGADKAVDVAVRERDEQLLLAGRDLVGDTVGLPRRQSQAKSESHDELDGLIDQLDAVDL
ncbi:MAG: ferredoxin family protein [Planctomycetota bacterium]